MNFYDHHSYLRYWVFTQLFFLHAEKHGLPWYLSFSLNIPQGQPSPGTEGKGLRTCLLVCHLGMIYDLDMVHSMCRPRCSLHSPANTHRFLGRRGQKGIFKQPGIPQNSPSLPKKELSPYQTERPQRFVFVCLVGSFNFIFLDSHLVFTVAATVLCTTITAHRHHTEFNWWRAVRAENLPTTISTFHMQVAESHLCGPSRPSSHLQRRRMQLRGWAQPPGQQAQGGGRNSRRWHPNHISSCGGITPGTNPVDRRSRPFHQDILPASRWFPPPCGWLFLQLLLHLLPHPFIFIRYNRRFGARACSQVSILQGTVPTCTRKNQEIINSYYLEEI